MTPEIVRQWKSHTSTVMWGVVLTLLVGIFNTYFDMAVVVSAVTLCFKSHDREMEETVANLLVANVSVKLLVLAAYAMVLYGLTKLADLVQHDGEYFRRIRTSFVVALITVVIGWVMVFLPYMAILVCAPIVWIMSIVSYYILRTGCRQLAETERYDKEATRGFSRLGDSASYRITLVLWIPVAMIVALFFCGLIVSNSFGDIFSGNLFEIGDRYDTFKGTLVFTYFILGVIGLWALITAILALVKTFTGLYGMHCGRPLKLISEEEFLRLEDMKLAAEMQGLQASVSAEPQPVAPASTPAVAERKEADYSAYQPHSSVGEERTESAPGTQADEPVEGTVVATGDDKKNTNITMIAVIVVAVVVAVAVGLFVLFNLKGDGGQAETDGVESVALQETIDEDGYEYIVVEAYGTLFKMMKVEDGPEGTFYIGETEVTQEQFVAIAGYNPSEVQGDDLPVTNVDFYDAQAFVEDLRLQVNDYGVYLPTEEEWEFAARGGNRSNGYRYSGSNNLDDVSWGKAGRIHAVKGKQPNELGIYDMSGNVWEWCSNAHGRGGSFLFGDNTHTVTFSSPGKETQKSKDLGFRIVMK